MNRRISVVIPTFNAAAHLAEAIASVRGQRLPVAELIVVDDGSTDGSADLARALGATVLSTGHNAGPSAARNVGWRAASGDLVAFLDADDYWEPDHCETLAELLVRFPESELAFSRVRTFGNRHNITRPVLPNEVPTWASLPLLQSNIVPQIAVMVRRSALDAVAGYDEGLRYSEDYDLWLRLSERAPFVCSHRVTAHYRVHDAQATAAAVKLLRGCWSVRQRYHRRARTRMSPAELHDVEERLLRGYEADLESAWHLADRELLRETLGLHPAVPRAERMHAAWSRKAYLFWYPWLVAKYLGARSPAGLVQIARRVRRRGTAHGV